jgi:hypothetical protein
VAYRNGGGRTLDSRGEARNDSESRLAQSLVWRKAGNCWRLFGAGKRRFGDVVPDDKYRGMWRCVLSGGRLSDMANLSWARNAVLEAAVREIEWGSANKRQLTPPFIRDSGAVFQRTSSQSDLATSPAAGLSLHTPRNA